MNYNQEDFEFRVVEYEDQNLKLKYKKYIKILLYYKGDCLLIFNFPPFKYEDENNSIKGVYLSIKAKIGNIIKHNLDYRETYHINQDKEILNKERKNISFQLKIDNFSKMLKDIISILITYYKDEYETYPKYLINKRVTGTAAKNKSETLYCYNLKKYKYKNKLKKYKHYKITKLYKENLSKTIISD